MPAPTQNRKTDVVRDFRRVVIKAPLCQATLLDLVANYQFRTKADLMMDIWRAGLVAYFDIDPEDLDELVARPLPRGTQLPESPKVLAARLLGYID